MPRHTMRSFPILLETRAMAGKLPPRELCVVIQDVVPLDYEELPLAFQMGCPPIPAGTICQVLKWDQKGIRATKAFIYYIDELTGDLDTGWVPVLALRPYDPQQDAETKKLERSSSDEVPPCGRCTS